MTTTLVFVYGTLKSGFPNCAHNAGRRVAGSFRTAQAYPLVVVRLPAEDRAPWLLNRPGEGLRVQGEVYAVDAAALAAMDRLEEVGLPTGYERITLALTAADGEAADGDAVVLRAQAYLKPADSLGTCLAWEGPYAAYTPALARGYWLADAPPVPGGVA